MGIKQWPHRKLKAVEKRLALLQAEHRYSTEEGLMAQYKAEIKDLEEKRNNLLQVNDDVTHRVLCMFHDLTSPGVGLRHQWSDRGCRPR